MASEESLAQAAVEALLEDEALRGDLTDGGFGPVIAWASGVAAARAATWLQQPDPHAAMWAGVADLKELVRGIADAANSLAPEPLLAAAGPLADAVLDALDEVDWTEDIDANARGIVAALAALPWAGPGNGAGVEAAPGGTA